jgi:hypothetical protein
MQTWPALRDLPVAEVAALPQCSKVLKRSIGRGTDRLTRTVLPQANAYAMIQLTALIGSFLIDSVLGRKPAFGTPIKNDQARMTGAIFHLKTQAGWKERYSPRGVATTRPASTINAT